MLLRGRSAALAWGLCGLTVLLATTRLALTIADPGAADPSGFGDSVPMAVFELASFTALAAIGALVASRQPRNPVGWFICAAPLLLEAGTLAERAYSSAVLADPGGVSAAQLALWLTNWTWVPALVPVLTLVPLLFPTGSPPTPRWRKVMWLAAGGGIAIVIGFALAPGPLDNYPKVENPFGVGAGLKGLVDAITGLRFLLVAAAVLASAAALIYRFRRSRGGTAAAQVGRGRNGRLGGRMERDGDDRLVRRLSHRGLRLRLDPPRAGHARDRGSRWDRHPSLPPLRHRRRHQPHPRLRRADGDARGRPYLGFSVLLLSSPSAA